MFNTSGWQGGLLSVDRRARWSRDGLPV